MTKEVKPIFQVSEGERQKRIAIFCSKNERDQYCQDINQKDNVKNELTLIEQGTFNFFINTLRRLDEPMSDEFYKYFKNSKHLKKQLASKTADFTGLYNSYNNYSVLNDPKASKEEKTRAILDFYNFIKPVLKSWEQNFINAPNESWYYTQKYIGKTLSDSIMPLVKSKIKGTFIRGDKQSLKKVLGSREFQIIVLKIFKRDEFEDLMRIDFEKISGFDDVIKLLKQPSIIHLFKDIRELLESEDISEEVQNTLVLVLLKFQGVLNPEVVGEISSFLRKKPKVRKDILKKLLDPQYLVNILEKIKFLVENKSAPNTKRAQIVTELYNQLNILITPWIKDYKENPESWGNTYEEVKGRIVERSEQRRVSKVKNPKSIFSKLKDDEVKTLEKLALSFASNPDFHNALFKILSENNFEDLVSFNFEDIDSLSQFDFKKIKPILDVLSMYFYDNKREWIKLKKIVLRLGSMTEDGRVDRGKKKILQYILKRVSAYSFFSMLLTNKFLHDPINIRDLKIIISGQKNWATLSALKRFFGSMGVKIRRRDFIFK